MSSAAFVIGALRVKGHLPLKDLQLILGNDAFWPTLSASSIFSFCSFGIGNNFSHLSRCFKFTKEKNIKNNNDLCGRRCVLKFHYSVTVISP